ncbi:hypothetical protein KFU94_21565 [Chloroflexi bacterium TSY]|nr:hypothetical protein [Chloroflexi bacterium TSY]
MAAALFQSLVDKQFKGEKRATHAFHVSINKPIKESASETGIVWTIESAGIWARPGRPASTFMRQVAWEWGLDLNQHRTRRIEQLYPLDRFDLILTMDRGQREALTASFPTLEDRIYLLTEMAGAEYDVKDPVGGALDAFRITASELERLVSYGFIEICKYTIYSE